MFMRNNSDMTRTHNLVLQAYVRVNLTDVLINNASLKRSFIAIFEVLYLPAVPIIVLCYWFVCLFTYFTLSRSIYTHHVLSKHDQTLYGRVRKTCKSSIE